jgi:hypothetical protein
MTKFAKYKSLKIIVWGKLTFDEKGVLHRVDLKDKAGGNQHPVHNKRCQKRLPLFFFFTTLKPRVGRIKSI